MGLLIVAWRWLFSGQPDSGTTRPRVSKRTRLFESPWLVDADEIRIAEEHDESLLCATPEMQAFLRSDGNDQFIVAGPRGSPRPHPWVKGFAPCAHGANQ
jgi:hypothetical protein